MKEEKTKGEKDGKRKNWGTKYYVGQVASKILRMRGWIKILLTIPNWKFSLT